MYRWFRQLVSVMFLGLLPPAACRFTPTCSVYCRDAVAKYGYFKGGIKCVWRVLRCHPFSRGGYDPA